MSKPQNSDVRLLKINIDPYSFVSNITSTDESKFDNINVITKPKNKRKKSKLIIPKKVEKDLKEEEISSTRKMEARIVPITQYNDSKYFLEFINVLLTMFNTSKTNISDLRFNKLKDQKLNIDNQEDIKNMILNNKNSDCFLVMLQKTDENIAPLMITENIISKNENKLSNINENNVDDNYGNKFGKLRHLSNAYEKRKKINENENNEKMFKKEINRRDVKIPSLVVAQADDAVHVCAGDMKCPICSNSFRYRFKFNPMCTRKSFLRLRLS
ncbi:hypothetical protein O3M35_007784 [Rhynocoris fuscipes]